MLPKWNLSKESKSNFNKQSADPMLKLRAKAYHISVKERQ